MYNVQHGEFCVQFPAVRDTFWGIWSSQYVKCTFFCFACTKGIVYSVASDVVYLTDISRGRKSHWRRQKLMRLCVFLSAVFNSPVRRIGGWSCKKLRYTLHTARIIDRYLWRTRHRGGGSRASATGGGGVIQFGKFPSCSPARCITTSLSFLHARDIRSAPAEGFGLLYSIIIDISRQFLCTFVSLLKKTELDIRDLFLAINKWNGTDNSAAYWVSATEQLIGLDWLDCICCLSIWDLLLILIVYFYHQFIIGPLLLMFIGCRWYCLSEIHANQRGVQSVCWMTVTEPGLTQGMTLLCIIRCLDWLIDNQNQTGLGFFNLPPFLSGTWPITLCLCLLLFDSIHDGLSICSKGPESGH